MWSAFRILASAFGVFYVYLSFSALVTPRSVLGDVFDYKNPTRETVVITRCLGIPDALVALISYHFSFATVLSDQLFFLQLVMFFCAAWIVLHVYHYVKGEYTRKAAVINIAGDLVFLVAALAVQVLFVAA